MLSGIFPPSVIEIVAIPLMLTLTALIGWPFAAPSYRRLQIGSGERIFLCLLLGTVIVSWVGTLLAIMGFFYWPVVLSTTLLLAGIYLWRSGGLERQTPQRDSALDLPPIYGRVLVGLLFVFAAWLYARPAESFIVFDDGGLYTSSGIALATEGSLAHSLSDVHLDGLSYDDFVNLFCSFSPNNAGFPTLYPGIIRWAFDRQVETAFLPVPKVWGAITVWFLGPSYVSWMAPFFGLLGLAAVYFFTKRLFGWGVALSATALLCTSFPQVWFARSPLSDIVAQVFVFGGLYLLTLVCRLEESCMTHHHWSTFSALALGALVLVRFEALLILLPLGAAVILFWRARTDLSNPDISHWGIVLTLFVVFGSALVLLVSRHYLISRSIILLPMQEQICLGAIALMGALGLAFYLWRQTERDGQRHHVLLAKLEHLLSYGPVAGWAVVGVLVVLRTMQVDASPHILVWLKDYLGLPLLFMGGLGGLWLLYRERQGQRPELVGLLAPMLVSLLVYSWRPLVENAHPWAMRRLVVLVVPALVLMASAAVVNLLHDLVGSKGNLRFVAPVGLLIWTVGCAILLGRRTAPFIQYREYGGLKEQMWAFGQSFPEDALLLFNDDRLGLGSRIAPVTELAFQRPSLVIREQTFDEGEIETVDAIIEGSLEHEQPVYLVTVNGHLGWRSDAWNLSWTGNHDFDFPRISPALKHLPGRSDVSRTQFWLDTYRIEPREASSLLTAPLDVSVGPGSYPYLREGFNSWEQMSPGMIPFRWTTGEAHIAVPWPAEDLDMPADFRLLLDISSWRPSRAPEPILAVYAEEELLFKEKLPKHKGWHTIQIVGQDIQNTGFETLDICLLVDIWSPENLKEEPDARELGLIFRGLKVIP